MSSRLLVSAASPAPRSTCGGGFAYPALTLTRSSQACENSNLLISLVGVAGLVYKFGRYSQTLSVGETPMAFAPEGSVMVVHHQASMSVQAGCSGISVRSSI